ncbi:MAG: efflux RND transporter permease subunit [Betaproteobacteria bacterium]|nr:efflux RND transporter permease subunit [Betaproteobacteria bacterium]
MISRVFIDRPVFAWVIAIVIMLSGVGAIVSLPVEQYPDIAPPTINIRTNYPGASAEALETSVTQIIEQQLTGIDGMIYFSSTSDSAGRVRMTVTFNRGTDPDIAQVQVQNRVQQGLSRLPDQVRQQGISVTKASTDFLLVLAVYDETGLRTRSDVSDYLTSTLQDPLARVPGVGDVNVFGSPYAMRIWLDPFKLSSFQLMPSDVIAAVEAQNTQVAAGQIGEQPALPGQMLNATVIARSRLTTPEEFRSIVVKTKTDGSKVLLQDVARVELGSETYTFASRLNLYPAAGIAIQLAPGADALETAELVKATVERAARSFPEGLSYAYPIDATHFIRLSIREVTKTLIEAIVLVVIVMFLFLQGWRATLIPAVAVPVVLLGTFGVLAAFGFTINTLTLFGLVLSIGLLVDDAIVVVENVERVMHENPEMSAREATIRSMDEIQTALIAIGLVLSAVFLPMAFFGGSVGEIYRQFSITVVSSMLLSVVVALVLTPALTATLLKQNTHAGRQKRSRLVRLASHGGERFNAWFQRSAERYRRGVAAIIHRPAPAMVVYIATTSALVLIFVGLPTSFLPVEDQGRAQIQFTLPPGATQQRTEAVATEIQHYFLTDEKANVSAVYTITGISRAGAGQNAGRGFIALAPWEQREGPENSASAIVQRASRELARLRDARFYALNPPPVRGLGDSSGFEMHLLNSGGLSREEFKARAEQLVEAAQHEPALSAVRLNTLEDVATLQIAIDEEKVGALGLAQRDVDATLTTAWGGNYVNDFVDRGRVKRVYVQGDAPYRSRPEDLASWFVRSADGKMTPFSAFATISWARAPTALARFNGQPAYEIQGEASAGRSSGDAMDRIEALAGQLPGTATAWSGLSYQERVSGGQAPLLYAVSLLVIFLCLAALFESWSIPASVMLVIPLGLVGAAIAVALRGLENDVYFQVGLLTTAGLTAKNAILIVEFADQAQRLGKSAAEAAIAAARLRLRPILMTSFAFIFGVLPLAVSTGAGAQSRIAIGTAVIGGMLTATVLAIFFVPLFYVFVRRWFGGQTKREEVVA